jgi:hypothetical protein
VTDPYVGPRPFERDEAGLFFGRLGETRLLVSMVLASRVVLLYALSGAGKTSLLNAAVVPSLEREDFFEVLAPARVRGLTAGAQPASGVNPYVAGVLSHWAGDGAASLPTWLEQLPHPSGPDGFPRPRAIILDQLEELFTAYPDHWRERPEVFVQIARALDDDPLLRVILAIREDYLAQLEPFRDLLPGRLEARIRLELLDPDAAREAVTGPLHETNRRFAPAVAERLVADLRATAMTDDAGARREFETQHVEPVQLQLVCSALWRDLPPPVTEITDEHVRRFGDVDQVLTDFYDGAISAAAAAARVTEPSMRQGFTETFITAMHTRGTAYASGASVGSVPLAAAEELERRRLIRAEWRANARWYELTHDRLIEPIERSNQAALLHRVNDLGETVRGALAALAGVLVGAVPATALANTLDNGVVAFTHRSVLAAVVLAVAALSWATVADRERRPRRCAQGFAVGLVAGAVSYGVYRSSAGFVTSYAVLGAIVGRAGVIAPGSWRATVGAAVGGGAVGALIWSVLIGATVLLTLLVYGLIIAGAWLPEVVLAGWRATVGDSRPRALVAGAAAATVVVAGVLTVVIVQANRARSENDFALSRALAAQSAGTSNARIAALIAVESARSAETAESTDAMVEALSRLEPTIQLPGGAITDLAVEPDGRTLAVAHGSGAVVLVDLQRRRVTSVLRWGPSVTSVASVPHSRTLAFTATDGSLAIWDPATGKSPRELDRSDAPLLDVAVDPQATYVAAGGEDGKVTGITFAPKRKFVVRGGSGPIPGVAFSPHGVTLVAGSDDGEVRVLGPSGQVRLGLSPRVRGGVRSVAFSPSGRGLAAGGGDGSVHVWRPTDWRITAIFHDHTAAVSSVAFSSGRELLASGGHDGRVVIRGAGRDDPLAILRGFGGAVNSVAFTPGGTELVVAGTDVTLRVLDDVLWSGDPARLEASICAKLGRSLTADEWDRYFPGEPYHATCG